MRIASFIFVFPWVNVNGQKADYLSDRTAPNFNYLQKIDPSLPPQVGGGKLSVADWWLTMV
jgi:hypothetical protein